MVDIRLASNFNLFINIIFWGFSKMNMSNEEILRKAMLKAQKNGFMPTWDGVVRKYDQYRIPFSHRFAKAFWGEEWGEEYQADATLYHPDEEPWKYYLKILVLEEDPLQYLEKFI